VETEIPVRPTETACPDLVVLGNLLVDDVVYDDGSTRMQQPGGAALYVALGASLWNVSVGIVSRIGDDYPADILQSLRERRVDLGGVRSIGRAGLRTWLLYEGDLRRLVHRLEGPTHAEVSPRFAEIPPSWLQSRAFHLAPMPFDLQGEWVAALQQCPDALISLDPYDLLTADRVGAWRELLLGVDILLFGEDEMEIAGGRRDPLPVLRRLAGPGRLRHLLFKQGPRGGLWLDMKGVEGKRWQARKGATIDPTGAGDAFAGGVLAGLLRGETMPAALQMGVVSASFALAAPGPDSLLEAALSSAVDGPTAL